MSEFVNFPAPVDLFETDDCLLADFKAYAGESGNATIVLYQDGSVYTSQGQEEVQALAITERHREFFDFCRSWGGSESIQIETSARPIPPNATQRTAGWHTDGLQMPERQHELMVCDRHPTVFAVGRLSTQHVLSRIYTMREGNGLEVTRATNKALVEGQLEVVTAKPYMVTGFTPFHLHASPLNNTGQTIDRSFMRVLPITKQ